MQSLRELFKIGNGPSSSHTIGPKRAAELFKSRNKDVDYMKVILYGSLSSTGKGHLTDKIIHDVLNDIEHVIVFDLDTECTVHPNTMDFIAYKNKEIVDKIRVYSVGGGTIKIEGEEETIIPHIYPHKNFDEIKFYCIEKNINLCQYVYEVENKDVLQEHLKNVWNVMQNSIKRGLETTGIIPGRLKIFRKAKDIYNMQVNYEIPELRKNRLLTSYAYSVSEENASGGEIVTAPTCGASGVLPAVLYYMKKEHNISDEKIIDALAIAGLIGNIVKQNASISGAECGCQAEIGTACSMAAAAAAYLLRLDINRIENSAEVAMEHHLGLTCDPIFGYVQIPCIERNGVAAIRALDAAYLSMLLGKSKYISFDTVVETMKETGLDLSTHYKETSNGGLAKKYCGKRYIIED